MTSKYYHESLPFDPKTHRLVQEQTYLELFVNWLMARHRENLTLIGQRTEVPDQSVTHPDIPFTDVRCFVAVRFMLLWAETPPANVEKFKWIGCAPFMNWLVDASGTDDWTQAQRDKLIAIRKAAFEQRRQVYARELIINLKDNEPRSVMRVTKRKARPLTY